MKKVLLKITTIIILQFYTRFNIRLDRKKRDFILFWQDQANKKPDGTKRCYLNSLKHFKKWAKADTFPMRKVNEEVFQDFGKYLLDTCKSRNTASRIFSNAMTVESVAERWRLIKIPVFVKRITLIRSLKEYLTNREIIRLTRTHCENMDVKRAFLFACLTGLRISDLREVRYCNLIRKKGEYFLSITMHKTKQPIYNEISKTVRSILFIKHNKTDKIFPNLPKNNVSVSYYLNKWVKEAGIDKHITMHNGRFTYGVMIMEKTRDIMAVQEALGHKSVLTTQWAYGHIKPQKIRAATRLDGVNLKFGRVKNKKNSQKFTKRTRRTKGKNRKNRGL